MAEAVTKERLHSSGEDYLKAIFILEAQHGSVRSVEVAAVSYTHLDVYKRQHTGCTLFRM